MQLTIANSGLIPWTTQVIAKATIKGLRRAKGGRVRLIQWYVDVMPRGSLSHLSPALHLPKSRHRPATRRREYSSCRSR